MERIEVKAALTADDDGAISGLAWPFGSADRVGDFIEKGAFRTAGARLPALWSHDAAETVGVWDSVRETDRGLEVSGRLLVNDVARAREVRALVKEGAATGLSIGFRINDAVPRKGGGRTIRDLELLEVSIVSIPAHPGAQVTAVKHGGPDVDKNETAPEAPAHDDRTAELEAKIAPLAEVPDTLDKVSKRIDDLERKVNRPRSAPAEDKPAAEVKAFTHFIRRGVERMDPMEAKDLRVANDTAGGYLAPEQFATEIIRNLVETSPVRQAARVSAISSGSLVLPKRTGTTTAYWVGETEPRTETQPAYGQVEIAAHELAAYIDVSNSLLEDAAIDIAAELARDGAEEFGRAEGAAFVGGSGIKQPEGLLTNADVATYANGHATELQVDGLLGIFHSLPMMYRNRGVWMMNAATIGEVRKLKDTNGDYLWREGLAEGNPPTILGRPVVEAVDMPDIEAAATPILFGAVDEAFRIVDRVGLQVLRDPYSVATSGIVRFHMRRRVGGRVVKAEAIKKLSMEV